jgi:hypothetical protein
MLGEGAGCDLLLERAVLYLLHPVAEWSGRDRPPLNLPSKNADYEGREWKNEHDIRGRVQKKTNKKGKRFGY